MYENELYHFGIKGMKWGVRRYQNKDGTFKPAGEKRYSNRQIRSDMNKTFNKTYKELHDKYKKTKSATAADKANEQAKNFNTKHLIDTYGKERMDQYYESERKKTVMAGQFLVGSLATLSVAALLGNKLN